MAFKHISLLWSTKGVKTGHMGDTAFFACAKKPVPPGHMGDTTSLPRQKTHITTFGALGSLAFDSTYDIK